MLLDLITRLFVIPASDRQPSRSHTRGLLGIGLLAAAGSAFMLLVPATPLSFVGEPFSVLRYPSAFAGVVMGFAVAVALNWRPPRMPWSRYVGAVVVFMLYQPVRALGPGVLALYHGSAAGAIAWFAAFTLTIAAIDARELRRAAGSEMCPADEVPRSGGLEFWDRN